MQANHCAQEEWQMKRFHVHLGVPDLAASIRFYSDLFGVPPTVETSDYAKWMIEDPRVNFAISHRGGKAGLNHLGLQADSAEELAGIHAKFAAADASHLRDEHEVSCCYARGNKHWTQDPQGIAWEGFHTLESIPLFGAVASDAQDANADSKGACGVAAGGCCAPAVDAPGQSAKKATSCCA
jgi:catechol 2,3-dioxygenase-like lactoylglutathione lyase family enzyme